MKEGIKISAEDKKRMNEIIEKDVSSGELDISEMTLRNLIRSVPPVDESN